MNTIVKYASINKQAGISDYLVAGKDKLLENIQDPYWLASVLGGAGLAGGAGYAQGLSPEQIAALSVLGGGLGHFASPYVKQLGGGIQDYFGGNTPVVMQAPAVMQAPQVVSSPVQLQ